MNKSVFNAIIATLSGLVAFLAGIACQKYGLKVSTAESLFWGVVVASGVIISQIPPLAKKIKYISSEIDWADQTVLYYQKIPAKYRQSFWLLFGFINLAFLFHTINFMWGNQDWRAVRFFVDHNEALSQGAFSAYWLQELLFGGKILPVANNLWSFAGLSFAGVMLAIYFNLPERAAPIVVTGLILTVTPYTLSVLYSVKTALGICWAEPLALAALLTARSVRGSSVKTYIKNIVSVLLFLIALGVSTAVTNFVLIAVLGSVCLKTTYSDITLKEAFGRTRQGLANFAAALMIYVLVLFLLNETEVLSPEHAVSLSFSSPLYRLPLMLKYAALEFVLPLPFMDITYKLLHLTLVIIAVFVLIFKAPNALAAARGLVLLPLVALCSVLTFVFSVNPEQHLTETLFFGLPAVYALSFALIIKPGTPLIKRLGYVLAVLLIFINFVRDAYALKVWKFGFDAESKLAERIITRLEKLPEFNISKKYTLLQIGEVPLRAKYYVKSSGEQPDAPLLDAAWYPEGASSDAYNFFYQEDIFEKDGTPEALRTPEIREYILNRARPWPARESLFISGSYIVIVLSDQKLERLRRELSPQY